eukprot:scaffold15776_cov75-Phaeocystis_antarctica.AAC.2
MAGNDHFDGAVNVMQAGPLRWDEPSQCKAIEREEPQHGVEVGVGHAGIVTTRHTTRVHYAQLVGSCC